MSLLVEGKIPIFGAVFDVDGTLLPKNSSRLNQLVPTTPAVTDAIRITSGLIGTGLVTANPLTKVGSLIDHLMLSGLNILSNGAQIYSREFGFIEEWKLNKTAALEIAKCFEGLGVVNWIQDDGEDRRNLNSYTPNKPFIVVAKHMQRVAAEEILLKIQQYDPNEIAGCIAQLHNPNDVDMFVAHPNADKGRSIRLVAELMGTNPKELAAFGDGQNDVDMFKQVGFGVAMGDAVPDLIRIATHITGTVKEDGVAQALNKYFLNAPFAIKES